MESTPRSNRLHIGVYGLRNAGKSSLINFITNQPVALVSDTPGTTTDPVLKNMELHPLGPVVFIDTAGMDDSGALGDLRVGRTKEMISRTDLALMVIPSREGEIDMTRQREFEWLGELKKNGVAVLGVLSQTDRLPPAEAEKARAALEERMGIPFAAVSAQTGEGRGGLLEAIVREAPLDFERLTILGDLIRPGDKVALIAPQDIQAPKGRLILPQVQILRDLLDHRALAMMVTMTECEELLKSLKKAPDLVVTDSQIFAQVDALLPREVPLTSFSILMARYKGDLEAFVNGARIIEGLKEGDKVLIAEACTHHALEGDIARQKLPMWLREKAGPGLTVNVTSGTAFPDDLAEYALIIHCGACMFTRKQLMGRLIQADAAGVPITNYGTAIAAMSGILERVVEIFPEIREKTDAVRHGDPLGLG